MLLLGFTWTESCLACAKSLDLDLCCRIWQATHAQWGGFWERFCCDYSLNSQLYLQKQFAQYNQNACTTASVQAHCTPLQATTSMKTAVHTLCLFTHAAIWARMCSCFSLTVRVFCRPRHLTVGVTSPFRLSPALRPRDGRGCVPTLMLGRLGLPGRRGLRPTLIPPHFGVPCCTAGCG